MLVWRPPHSFLYKPFTPNPLAKVSKCHTRLRLCESKPHGVCVRVDDGHAVVDSVQPPVDRIYRIPASPTLGDRPFCLLVPTNVRCACIWVSTCEFGVTGVGLVVRKLLVCSAVVGVVLQEYMTVRALKSRHGTPHLSHLG